MRPSLATLRGRGSPTCHLVLAVVVLAGYAVAGVVAWLLSGPWGPAAAGVAAAVCWLGAAAALEATIRVTRRQHVLAGMMVGMALRMGIPLASVIAVYLGGGPLMQAGVLYYFLFFYPLTLAVETALSLPRPADAKPSTAPRTLRGPLNHGS